MTFRKLLLKAIILWLAVTVLGSVIHLIIWDTLYTAPELSNWRPLIGLRGVLLLLPFGWFIALLTPAFLLVLLGVYLSKRIGTHKYLAFSVFGGLVFAWFWPRAFFTMMSV